ncbi:MAG: YoaK family protein [Hyphomicrobiales bacterium]|nr:YoaK family protein [Hyphomicrobiales bacterium]
MRALFTVAGFSFVAGFVDTVGFIALFGLFTAHVTGNFVLIGASIAGDGAGALAKLLALPVFILAVVAVTLAVRRGEARGRANRAGLTVAQIVFLAAFMAAGGLLGPFTNPDAWAAIGVGFLGVAAMAVQNAASRLLDSGPPTTIMTGNTTQAVIDAVDMLRGGSKDGTAARLRGLLGATVAFAGGAILGALGYLAAGYWCLGLPIILLITFAFAHRERKAS